MKEDATSPESFKFPMDLARVRTAPEFFSGGKLYGGNCHVRLCWLKEDRSINWDINCDSCSHQEEDIDRVMLQRDFAKNALLQILFTILHEAAPLDDVISLSSSKVPYDTRSTFCYLGWLLWSARDERIFEREEL